MFGHLKNLLSSSANSSNDLPGVPTAAQMIFLQLPLCGLEPGSLSAKLAYDEFALGYVFGVADMANYQFNQPDPGDQYAALTYIRHVFIEALGTEGDERFLQALSSQSSKIFGKGRQTGADDLGNWVKSQGKIHALGLTQHFSQ